MSDNENLSLGLLVLRLGVAYVFLLPAIRCTTDAFTWKKIKEETAILFPWLAPDLQREMGRYAAIIGVLMMYFSGLSMLTGAEPRLGGVTIAVFSLLGIRIHNIRREEALALVKKGDAMAAAVYGGLTASSNKNWSLIATGVAFFLIGAGKYAVPVDFTGKLLGWGN